MKEFQRTFLLWGGKLVYKQNEAQFFPRILKTSFKCLFSEIKKEILRKQAKCAFEKENLPTVT